MTKVNKTKAKNAATGAPRHAPRPMNMHLFNTAGALTAAAFPWASDPAYKDAALEAVGELTQQMMAGLEAYKTTPEKAVRPEHPSIWEKGSTKLLSTAEGAPKNAPCILLVPSLINRPDILDLDAEHSFVAFLKGQGFKPYIIAWGPPGQDEMPFSVNTYITDRLYPALEHLAKQSGPVHLIGYCMGGTIAAGALAASKTHQKLVRSLTLLATPWDFHAGDKMAALRIQGFTLAAQPVMEATGTLPVDWIQALFASIDPLFAFNKFRSFARMAPGSDEARRFVIVEDWLNDGVDLAAPAAKQALEEWYGDNQTFNGVWTIGPNIVDPKNIACPTFVVAAANDRLVPKDSALAIVQQIDACQSIAPDIGHIGLMASNRAVAAVWEPIAAWLKSQNK